MKFYHADHALLAEGFAAEVRIAVDARGDIAGVETGADSAGCERITGWLLPGLVNAHSHAFQRALAGRVERRGPTRDSFWTWREGMYRLAGRLDPETLEAVAAQLYVEMLESGFTSVCEFHYVHHQPDGRPYAESDALSLAILAAAQETGIGLTHLPVLYQSGGFDGAALAPRQRRFHHELDAYLDLLERLRGRQSAQVRLGFALHSLRAVPVASQRALLAAQPLPGAPIHIHIAEQAGEVMDCLVHRGARPVRWLLDEVDLDARWTLVHATHVDGPERDQLAASGACVALCPTTEANLGDGLFPLLPYLEAGGRIAIGSDSHVSVSPVEELRWLEYGQRLLSRSRCVTATAQQASVGQRLYLAALEGGAQASGRNVGRLQAGARADWIVLDPEQPDLELANAEILLDLWLFLGNRPAVRDVMVGGSWQVREGRHLRAKAIQARYRQALAKLWRPESID